MNLCRILGGMTVDEMLERISSKELIQWQALYELEDEDERFSKMKNEVKSRW